MKREPINVSIFLCYIRELQNKGWRVSAVAQPVPNSVRVFSSHMTLSCENWWSMSSSFFFYQYGIFKCRLLLFLKKNILYSRMSHIYESSFKNKLIFFHKVFPYFESKTSPWDCYSLFLTNAWSKPQSYVLNLYSLPVALTYTLSKPV